MADAIMAEDRVPMVLAFRMGPDMQIFEVPVERNDTPITDFDYWIGSITRGLASTLILLGLFVQNPRARIYRTYTSIAVFVGVC